MTFKRAVSGVTAAVLALLSGVATAGVAEAGPSVDREITAVVDPSTANEYPGSSTASTYFSSTGHAGRVWTDKTVLTGQITSPDDKTPASAPRVLDKDELAVSLSALGSTRHFVSTVQTPIDVVLILDVSGSMGYCANAVSNSTCSNRNNSRAQAMVEAVNTALDVIVEDNDDNRVALVSFAQGTKTLRDLSEPKKIPGDDQGRYVRLNSTSLSLEYANTSGALDSVAIAGGTNTQLGLYEGMNVLAKQSSSSVTGSSQRLPNVVLLTDGEPTFSAQGDWWNPGTGTQGTGNANKEDWGNGFKAAMTAAHMKKRIAGVYVRQDNAVDFSPKVYTVGLGVKGLSPTGLAHSQATLDPATYLGREDNVFFKGFTEASKAYKLGQSPTVPVNGTQMYAVTHPPSNDVTDMGYNDAYWDPVTTDELVDVFTQIAKQITAPVANPPVETEVGSESTTGYVTFEDPLGDFMEVTAMDRLTFCSLPVGVTDLNKCLPKTFGSPTMSSDGWTDTYVFSGQYKANDIYPQTDVKNIVITVERNADPAVGDVVTMKVPSALLPMRDSYITLDENDNPVEMSVQASQPVRLFYVVAPKRIGSGSTAVSVLDYLENPLSLNGKVAGAGAGAGTALLQYMRDNSTDGVVRFYANDFTVNGEVKTAEATAVFEPAVGNIFYRFGTDTTLYIDEHATMPISEAYWNNTLGDDVPVYYRYEDYQQINAELGTVKSETKVLKTTKALLELPAQDGLSLLTDAAGFKTAPAGMRDYARAGNMDHLKCADLKWDNNGVPSCPGGTADVNRTETDPLVRQTTYNARDVVVTLGNNGYLTTTVPGSLTITKNVVHSAMTPKADTRFNFVVTFGGVGDTDSFAYTVYGPTDATTPLEDRGGWVQSGGMIELEDGETALVVGLPDGATYEVSEANLPQGYTQTSPEGAATGTITIPQEQPESVVFQNTYTATPVKAAPSVTKVLVGEWGEGDTFTFNLCGGGPPASCVEPKVLPGEAVIATDDSTSSATGTFDDITFTKPGTYVYTLTEEDENLDNPSISYSAASYQWTVAVTDGGGGELEATSTLTPILNDAGQAPEDSDPVSTATFTNVRNPDEVRGTLQATKLVQDLTRADVGGDGDGDDGNAPSLAHKFIYKYLGAYVSEDSDGNFIDPEVFADSGHLLNGERSEEKSNAVNNSALSSSELTFTHTHVGHKFYYSVEEVAPPSGSFVTHDKKVYIYEITVDLDQDVWISGEGTEGKHPVTAHSQRCVTTQDEVTVQNPLGGCSPDTGEFSQVKAEFLNIYSASNGEAQLEATKNLVGRDWDDDTFTFKVEGDNPVTQAAIADGDVTLANDSNPDDDALTVSATNPGANNVVFNLRFSQQGEFRFRVTEVRGTAGGVTYAPNVVLYTVKVTNPATEAGTNLVAVPELVSTAAVFTNNYEPEPVRTTPKFVKKLTGRPWLPTDEFTFEIEPVGDAPDPAYETATVNSVNATGFDFGAIQFDEAGTYVYTVREQSSPSAPAVTHDESTVFVTITVWDDGLGKLQIESTTYTEQIGEDLVEFDEFVNAYTVSLPWQFDVSKVLTGRDMREGEFTFTVTPDERTAQRFGTPDPISVTGRADGPVETMTGPQFVFSQDDAGTSYCWTVSEDVPDVPLQGVTYDPTDHTVCVDVVNDPSQGVLEAAATIISSEDSEGAEPIVITSADVDPVWPVVAFENVFKPTSWTLAKTSNPAEGRVERGEEITYTLTVEDIGGADSLAPTDVVITDVLTDVVGPDRAEFLGFIDEQGNIAQHDDAAFDDDFGILTWNIGDLDGTAELSYKVKVDENAYGVTLRNVVTGSGNVEPESCADTPEPDDTDEVCSTVHTTGPAWTMSKSADPKDGTELAPGEKVTYTLTVENLSQELVVTDVVVTDDLSGVLDVAGLDEPLAEPTLGSVGGPSAEGILTWEIDTLEPGAVETFTYSVTVNAGDAKVYGTALQNKAWGTGQGDVGGNDTLDELPPGECTEGEPCTTDHTVKTPEWTVAKTSTSEAVPGGTLTYEITVTNTGDIPLWDATISDGPVDHGKDVTDIWDLIGDDGWDGMYTVRIGDDGEPKDYWDADRTNGLQIVIDEIGIDELGDGEYAVVTFTVKLPDRLDEVHLRNTVTGSLIPDPAGPGEPDNPLFPPTHCATPTSGEPCSVDHTYTHGTWDLDKTADTPSGTSTVLPGETVTYTLTVTNTDPVNAVTDVVVTDDLTEVLADGVVTLVLDEQGNLAQPDAGAVRLEGNTLIWDVGTLAAGKAVTYTYTVTVTESATAYGTTLHNEAWGIGRGATEDGREGVLPPGKCTADEPCSTDHEVPVPEWTVAKTADTPSGTSTVEPGDTVAYTLTVENTGLHSPVTGVVVTDDLSAVLADGLVTLDSLVDPVQGSVSMDDTTLTWDVGTLAAGELVTYTYWVTVGTDEDVWGLTLHNAAWGTGRGPTEEVLEPVWCTEAVPCTTDHEVGIPEPDPEPTGHGLPAPTDPEPAVSTVSAPKVSSGGALASTGGKVAALVAAAGLLLTAAALIVRRRRVEPTD